GAAMPLVWAHAEYVKLIHSLASGKVLDKIKEVEDRYIKKIDTISNNDVVWKLPNNDVEFWTFQRKDDPVRVKKGQKLWIPSDRPFQFRWTNDSWRTVKDDLQSSPSVAPQIHLLDVPTTRLAGPRIDFTFYWPTDRRWEGRNFSITVDP